MRAEINAIQQELRKHIQTEKIEFLYRFFKTGKGEYAEGDQILGVCVPVQRQIAKKYFQTVSLQGLLPLLHSKWHEERLTALLMLVNQFEKANEQTRKSIFEFYLQNTKYINHWDLVDSSAYKIVGQYLLHQNRKLLYEFVQSSLLWERRIAIVATLRFIQNNQFKDTIQLSKLLLKDQHDLIHKASGWMLREVGKRDETLLIKFLHQNKEEMPRTMLRYAIERLENRKEFL